MSPDRLPGLILEKSRAAFVESVPCDSARAAWTRVPSLIFFSFSLAESFENHGGGGRVMEHREIPRIVSAEGRPRDARAEPVADRPRVARFVTSPSERRLVLSRLGLSLLASVLTLIAIGVIGSQVVERMVRWLHS